MVWAFLTASGKGSLAFVDGTINADGYISLLRENLLPFLDELPLSERFRVIFQQDNARPHVARKTMQFLREEDIMTTSWPALSPDLNPIENVWALMKREVRKAAPTSLSELRVAISAAWDKCVTPSLCERLYASMKGRLLKVISNCGIRP
jgi:transposase